MDIQNLDILLTPSGQEVLLAAVALQPREADFLGHFQTLSRQFPRELVRAALEIAILRSEAVSKFPQAEKMYFTRDAMQQASGYQVSRYRARRFRGYDRLVDLGCSVGGDTLAFAEVTHTFGVDRHPLRLAMAQANLQALSLHADFVQADLLSPLPLHSSPFLPSSPALFFDPARRSSGRRIFSVKDYIPPLSLVHEWLPRFPALGVKISPGVKLGELVNYDAEVEFISLRGALKEAVLWFGPLKSAERRATVLPGAHTLVSDPWPVVGGQLSEPEAYLYEPDPSVLRAGLVRTLVAQLDAYQLDPDIAYLTADHKKTTPFARVWAVVDWFPFQLKRLRAYLRERGIGRVVVKKRGSPLQPETLIRDLRLRGESERVVFLTRLRGRPIVVVCLPNKIPTRAGNPADGDCE